MENTENNQAATSPGDGSDAPPPAPRGFEAMNLDPSVKQALDVPIAFMPQFNAYDKARVSGKVGAQTNICDPPDFTQTKVKG